MSVRSRGSIVLFAVRWTWKLGTQTVFGEGSDDATVVVATVHPSSVLRSPAGDREANEKAFLRDISKIAKYV